MKNHTHTVHRSNRLCCSNWLLTTIVVLVSSLQAGTASAYTPDDPVVKKMVQRGIKFLEGYDPKSKRFEGETVLMAYTHFKVEHDSEHPLVKRGLAVAESLYKRAAAGKHEHKSNYEVPLTILLFAAVDAQKYRTKLEVLQRYLFNEQRSHGGFAYPGEELGDISQIQYVMLAIWTLDRMGVKLDYQRVLASLKYLLRVQDPAGGWPYNGKDPGPGKPLTRQTKVTDSMTLAGASSVLIAGDAIRVWGDTVDDTDPGIVGLPQAIKLYKEDTNVDRRKRVTFSKEPIFRAIKMSQAWRQQSQYKRTGTDWYYYQLYTLERFESFVEIANGLPKDKSPDWYNKGVDQLRTYQGTDGGWTDNAKTSHNISTAFAILFLIRSTQKAIPNSADGKTQGGRGFSDNVADAQLVGGVAKTPVAAQEVSNLLDLLEKDGADDLADKALPEDLKLAEDPKSRAAQFDRLERLLRGSNSWQARRVAARVLGRSDEMRVVPALIFALSDNDEKVKLFARDGLRFISRKFDGYGMPKKPSYAELREAQLKWRNWYITMNPSYVFLDQQ